MRAQTPVERIQVLEDEHQALDSRVDSRTARLWAEIEALKIQVQDLRERLQEATCRA